MRLPSLQPVPPTQQAIVTKANIKRQVQVELFIGHPWRMLYCEICHPSLGEWQALRLSRTLRRIWLTPPLRRSVRL